jgi:antirestriction protein ArdC
MAINIYEMVTNRIIEQLEKGVVAWRKTWAGSEPINYVSRKQYRGINLLLLPFGGEYLKYKQALEAGGHVKKGEKSHLIIFWKMLERENKDGEKEELPYLRYSNVFHISQCDGIESKIQPAEPTGTEPIAEAQVIFDEYINRSKITFRQVNGINAAFYKPSTDSIVLPMIEQFESAVEYYTVAFHEAAHSTGHESRLNRFSGKEKISAYGGALLQNSL